MPRIIGGGTLYPTRELPSEARAREILTAELARTTAHDLTRRGYEQLDLDRLEQRGHVLADPETGKLWQHDEGEPPRGRSVEHYAFGLTDSLGLRWYRRPERGPRTVTEFDRREQRRREERERQESDRKLDVASLRLRAEPVTLAETAKLPDLTLRQAVAEIDAIGGTVEVRSGRVIVAVPVARKGSTEYGPKRAVKLAQIVYAGEREILEIQSRDGDVNPEKLADRRLLPSGRTLPGS